MPYFTVTSDILKDQMVYFTALSVVCLLEADLINVVLKYSHLVISFEGCDVFLLFLTFCGL